MNGWMEKLKQYNWKNTDRLAPAALVEVGIGTGLTLAQYPAATAVTAFIGSLSAAQVSA